MDESIVKHLDEPAKTLKLSEAIRIGAKMRPIQCRFTAFKLGESCALGAALEGSGMRQAWHNSKLRISDVLGIDEHLAKEIVRRNDIEDWSRERIAGWLEAQGY